MAADIDPSGQFDPLHAAHAIEQVALVVQFNRPMVDEELAAVRVVMLTLQSELPAVQQLRALNFALINGNASVAPAEVDAGLSLSRIGPNGSVEKELKLERQSITYRCTTYTRWAEISAECLKYFSTVFPPLSDGIHISSLGLTFVDKFIWSGNPLDAKPRSLLSEESPFLGKYVFDLKDMWHLHTGAFLKPSDETKRLLNINIDCGDELYDGVPKRVVGISTVINDLFNQHGFTPSTRQARTSLEFVSDRMNQLHEVLKDVFAQLINAEMKVRTGLLTKK